MLFYAILIFLNLVGMAFLFYIHQRQKEINTEFLKNAILMNALVQQLKEVVDELETRIGKAENEIKKTK